MKSIPKIGNHEKLYMIPFKSGTNRIRQGCRFCPRCAYAMDICREKEPELVEVGEGRKVRCHLHTLSKKGRVKHNGKRDITVCKRYKEMVCHR